MNKDANFEFNQFYHVFNRTNNKEKLFKNLENRKFFLRRYGFYLKPFVDIHAYALLGNHFHFSIRVKPQKEISSYLNSIPLKEHTVAIKMYLESTDKKDRINELIIAQHHRFFISYSQAINKMFKRQGNLFSKKFKRSLFSKKYKFKYFQYYLHHNARKHDFVKSFKDYVHHSYFDIINGNDWLVDTTYVIEQFGSLQAFIDFHEKVHYSDKFEGLIIE